MEQNIFILHYPGSYVQYIYTEDDIQVDMDILLILSR
jgi:hypothetical protein